MERLSSYSTGKKDYSIVIFLLVSMGLHAGSLFVAAYLTRPEPEKPPSTIEIELAGEPDQPPPLGTNDTETGPPITEEPTPPPIPEDTPPPPIVPNDFEVPEEDATPAPPAATPKTVPKNTPKPGPVGTPSFNPNARPGAKKGVDAAHEGVEGGKGEVKSKGGKADFTSTPNMIIPANLRQRLASTGFKLSPASASISYSNGQITSVTITRSSGNSALDAQMIRHVSKNFQVVPGRGGKATLPVSIRL